jgi:hypothetical protein
MQSVNQALCVPLLLQFDFSFNPHNNIMNSFNDDTEANTGVHSVGRALSKITQPDWKCG